MATYENYVTGGTRPAWTIRSINGSPLPKLPIEIVHELYTVDRDSYEDLNGNLQRNILGVKDKFQLTFGAMNHVDATAILNMVKDPRLTVVFEDFYDPSVLRTAIFYRGDVKKNPYQAFGNGKYLFNRGAIAFNLIAYNVRPL